MGVRCNPPATAAAAAVSVCVLLLCSVFVQESQAACNTTSETNVFSFIEVFCGMTCPVVYLAPGTYQHALAGSYDLQGDCVVIGAGEGVTVIEADRINARLVTGIFNLAISDVSFEFVGDEIHTEYYIDATSGGGGKLLNFTRVTFRDFALLDDPLIALNNRGLLLDRVTVTNVSSSLAGGSVVESNGELTIIDSMFTNCTNELDSNLNRGVIATSTGAKPVYVLRSSFVNNTKAYDAPYAVDVNAEGSNGRADFIECVFHTPQSGYTSVRSNCELHLHRTYMYGSISASLASINVTRSTVVGQAGSNDQVVFGGGASYTIHVTDSVVVADGTSGAGVYSTGATVYVTRSYLSGGDRGVWCTMAAPVYADNAYACGVVNAQLDCTLYNVSGEPFVPQGECPTMCNSTSLPDLPCIKSTLPSAARADLSLCPYCPPLTIVPTATATTTTTTTTSSSTSDTTSTTTTATQSTSTPMTTPTTTTTSSPSPTPTTTDDNDQNPGGPSNNKDGDDDGSKKKILLYAGGGGILFVCCLAACGTVAFVASRGGGSGSGAKRSETGSELAPSTTTANDDVEVGKDADTPPTAPVPVITNTPATEPSSVGSNAQRNEDVSMPVCDTPLQPEGVARVQYESDATVRSSVGSGVASSDVMLETKFGGDAEATRMSSGGRPPSEFEHTAVPGKPPPARDLDATVRAGSSGNLPPAPLQTRLRTVVLGEGEASPTAKTAVSGEHRGSTQSSYTITVDEAITEMRMDDPLVERKEFLGSGTFGDVYRYNWNYIDVAVKVIKTVNPAAIQDFIEEAQTLAQLRCPFCVSYAGICLEPLAIVTEYMAGGDLFEFLKNGDDVVTEDRRIGIALNVTAGLAFLHSHNIPHRDLKPANILLTKHYEAKLADFGLSGEKDMSLDGACTPLYAAPEVLGGGTGTAASDVYSLGVILVELLGRVKPFEGTALLRESQPELAPTDMSTLAAPKADDVVPLLNSMLETDPSRRPEISVVLRSLQRIYNN